VSNDVLVDNSVAKNFCNPLDPHYKTFISWLFREGVLVVTQRLIAEYHSTMAASPSETSIVAVMNRLLIVGRLMRCRKNQLNGFRFPARVARRLRSNKREHDTIRAVMLSDRKFALTLDGGLQYDINSYPGFAARAEKRPQDLPYASGPM
jgi:hypothetical protein